MYKRAAETKTVNQAKPKLVMVGNGMAGVRTLEELLKQAPTAYDITVIGAEPYPNYNRIMLSPVLAGEQQWDDIILNDHDWYTQHGIRLHTGQTVVAMDRAHQRLICASGLSLPYDHVLLAPALILLCCRFPDMIYRVS